VWSRPSFSRNAAVLAAFASRPRIACAGSLGSNCVAANTTNDTMNRVTTPSNNRRAMNFSTPQLFDIRASYYSEKNRFFQPRP
jgi:hypothetical protein